MTMYKMHKLHQ